MIKKCFVLVSLSLVVLIGLTTFESEAQSEKKTLVWWKDSQDQTVIDAIQKTVIEPFEAANPTIEVKIEYFGDYDRVLTTAMSAGKGPDIIHLHGPSYAIEFVDADMLLALENYSRKFGWDKKIFPWALGSSTYKGHLTSIPYHYETMILYYNKTMFEEKGWRLPSDWQGFVALCETIEKDGIIPVAFGSADFTAANSWMTTVFFNNVVGPDKLKDALTGKLPWTENVFKESVDRYRYLWRKGWITKKQSQSLTMADSWGLWQDRRAAMKIEGTWAFGDIDSFSKGFEWDWAPLPSFGKHKKAPVIIGIGSSIGINAKTKYPEEAVKFLDFLMSDPKRAAKTITAAKGDFWLPINISKDDFPASLDERIGRTFDWISEGVRAGNVGFCSWTFWPPKTDTFQYQNLDSVVLDRMTIDFYLTESQKIFEKELNEKKVPALP